MLKIVEYNTITGEKVELKELEKYGLKIKYDEDTGKPTILEKRYLSLSFSTSTRITFKKKFRIRLFDNRQIWLSSIQTHDKNDLNKWQDTLYDLIKDGLVEKVEN